MVSEVSSAAAQGVISTQLQRVQNNQPTAPEAPQPPAPPPPPPPADNRGASVDTTV
ncbi:MAG: hypothetical protein HGA90_02940 [Alphaproteobacteria bacterium]|nr:hypothetical protein [Alphaproteobacteria bacterium]